MPNINRHFVAINTAFDDPQDIIVQHFKALEFVRFYKGL